MISQMEESREVNNSFPEALKGPILRRVQFSTVSRVDNLGAYLSPISLNLTFSANFYGYQWTKYTKWVTRSCYSVNETFY